MKFSELKEQMRVVDRDYPWYGAGEVIKLLKTRVHIHFAGQKVIVYDKTHVQFLKESK